MKYAAYTNDSIWSVEPTTEEARVEGVAFKTAGIAALGCNSTATCTANRKFMFAPDVVVEPAPNSGTHILLIGSGDVIVQSVTP